MPLDQDTEHGSVNGGGTSNAPWRTTRPRPSRTRSLPLVRTPRAPTGNRSAVRGMRTTNAIGVGASSGMRTAQTFGGTGADVATSGRQTSEMPKANSTRYMSRMVVVRAPGVQAARGATRSAASSDRSAVTIRVC